MYSKSHASKTFPPFNLYYNTLLQIIKWTKKEIFSTKQEKLKQWNFINEIWEIERTENLPSDPQYKKLFFCSFCVWIDAWSRMETEILAEWNEALIDFQFEGFLMPLTFDDV